MDERIDQRGIAEMLGYSVRYVREFLVHSPTFPQPVVAAGPRRRFWSAAEVAAWATPKGRKPGPAAPVRPSGPSLATAPLVAYIDQSQPGLFVLGVELVTQKGGSGGAMTLRLSLIPLAQLTGRRGAT